MTREVCVCVPARNEADRLPILLEALSRQRWTGTVKVALCVNNSDDGGALAAVDWSAANVGALDLEVVERVFPPALAHAGSARRAAMDLGAERMDATGILVSTDADCRPPETWIAAIMAAMADDAVVGGAIRLDEAEPLEPGVVALRSRWDAYWAVVRAIEDTVDPRAWDPAPRHGDHTGASLAMTVELYRRAGGVPVIPVGEDLALVEAAVAAGGRLVHPPAVWTRASARTAGRARDGMAAEMERLAACAAAGRAPMAPHLDHWRARAEWRRAARGSLSAAELLREERALPAMPCDMALPEVR